MEIKKLFEIRDWLNENYSQENHKNFETLVNSWYKPQILRYDKHTAIALWACGAIVLIGGMLHFIEGDDGVWVVDMAHKPYGETSMMGAFTVMYAEQLAEALRLIYSYVKENGTMVEQTQTTIAHYTL